jgi:hypothetical protein
MAPNECAMKLVKIERPTPDEIPGFKTHAPGDKENNNNNKQAAVLGSDNAGT